MAAHRRGRGPPAAGGGSVGVGSRLLGYVLEAQIGSGSYGDVFLGARTSDGLQVAIKVSNLLKMRAKERLLVRRECQLLSTVDHAHVVRLYDWHEMGIRHIIMVMELCDTDLAEYLASRQRALDEEFCTSITAQYISAMVYLRQEALIVHRDLKPANTGLKYGPDGGVSIKLLDFGFARKLTEEFMQSQAGTPYYAAPEILNGSQYTASVDSWALGVIMYEMAYLRMPFDATSMLKLIERINRAKVKYPRERNGPDGVAMAAMSSEYRDLLEGFLRKEPSERIDITRALDHPLFRPLSARSNASTDADVLDEKPRSPGVSVRGGSEAQAQLIFEHLRLFQETIDQSRHEREAQRMLVHIAECTGLVATMRGSTLDDAAELESELVEVTTLLSDAIASLSIVVDATPGQSDVHSFCDEALAWLYDQQDNTRGLLLELQANGQWEQELDAHGGLEGTVALLTRHETQIREIANDMTAVLREAQPYLRAESFDGRDAEDILDTVTLLHGRLLSRDQDFQVELSQALELIGSVNSANAVRAVFGDSAERIQEARDRFSEVRHLVGALTVVSRVLDEHTVGEGGNRRVSRGASTSGSGSEGLPPSRRFAGTVRHMGGGSDTPAEPRDEQVQALELERAVLEAEVARQEREIGDLASQLAGLRLEMRASGGHYRGGVGVNASVSSINSNVAESADELISLDLPVIGSHILFVPYTDHAGNFHYEMLRPYSGPEDPKVILQRIDIPDMTAPTRPYILGRCIEVGDLTQQGDGLFIYVHCEVVDDNAPPWTPPTGVPGYEGGSGGGSGTALQGGGVR